jgi:hypothetical protein
MLMLTVVGGGARLSRRRGHHLAVPSVVNRLMGRPPAAGRPPGSPAGLLALPGDARRDEQRARDDECAALRRPRCGVLAFDDWDTSQPDVWVARNGMGGKR